MVITTCYICIVFFAVEIHAKIVENISKNYFEYNQVCSEFNCGRFSNVYNRNGKKNQKKLIELTDPEANWDKD